MRQFLMSIVMIIALCPVLFAKGVMKEFKGVRLGDAQADVLKKLGAPKSNGGDNEEFGLGGDDSVRITYDEQKMVRSIVIYIYGDNSKAPLREDVTGDAKVETSADGSKISKITLDKEDIYVSMFRSSGDSPMTIITISKR